ncbi:MAG: hypothetical protein ABIO70_07555, partial [Pseudomonadota bacterium]
PRRLARAAGKPWKVFRTGLDEQDLKRAAAAQGVRSCLVQETRKGRGRSFAALVRRHLGRGLPGILLVDDFAHWVAVVGWAEGRFLIMDPLSKHAFNRWSVTTFLRDGWNRTWDEDDEDEDEEDEDEREGEPSQYFALLLERRDGKPPCLRVTEEYARLCETGSVLTDREFVADLREIVARAARGRGRRGGRDGEPLADLLARHEKTILRSVNHWSRTRQTTAADRRRLYRDYLTMAAASGIRVPPGSDEVEIVVQVTANLSTYAWVGRL